MNEIGIQFYLGSGHHHPIDGSACMYNFEGKGLTAITP